MALTTIAGTIVVPSGAAPDSARLLFTLVSWDEDNAVVYAPDPIEEVLTGNTYSVALESTTDKVRQCVYKVELSWYSKAKRTTLVEALGVIAIAPSGGPFSLPDLLAAPITEPVPADILALALAAAESALANSVIAAAAAEALIDISGYKMRASEPVHADFKLFKDGVWISRDWLVMVGAGQSNRAGNANATDGDKTGPSTGNVFAWNGTSIVQATLGSAPFNTAAGQVNSIDFHEAHRLSVELQRPVLIILHGIPGSGIGTWLPPYAGNGNVAGANWTGLNAKITAALTTGASVLWGKNTVDVFGWSQGEDEYDLAPLYTLSTDRYPALINGVLGASWASDTLKFIATQCLPQSAGGTAFAANTEWDKVVASGAFPRVFVATGEGLVTTGADTGQIVHYSGASLQQLGYRSADIYLGRDDGVTSGAGEAVGDAIGGLRWKNRTYVRLADLSFFPTNTYNQAITIGTTIAGVSVVFEVDGVRTEVVSTVSSSVYTLNSASDADVVVWYPVDAARDQSPQLSLNSAAGQGMLRSIWINPMGGLGQVFLAGHDGLIHSVEPKSWPRPDPGNPILPLNGLATFRINGSPLVTFDNFIAADMPTTLTLLSFTSTTPVPGAVRAAIDAENTARGGTISVSYGTAYMPAAARTLTLEDFGADAAASDNSAAIIRALTFAAGRKVVGAPGAIYQLTTAVSFTGPVNLDMSRSKVYMAANVEAFYLKSTPLGPYALTANYDYTATPLQLSVAAMASAPKPGQIMKIVSKARDLGNRDGGSSTDQYRTGEHFVVGIGSTTTNIVLTAPLQFYLGGSDTWTVGDEAIIDAYTTASQAQVIALNMDDKFYFAPPEIEYAAGNEATPWTARSIRLRGQAYPVIDSPRIVRGYGPGISITGTYGARIINPTVLQLINNTGLGQFGYGISDSGWGTVVEGGNIANTRHGYTTSGARSTYSSLSADGILGLGRCGNAIISNATGSGGLFAIFDTHASGENITFANCIATAGGNDGFAVRGRNVTLDAPVIVGCASGIQVQTEYASGDPDEDFYNNGKRTQDFTFANILSPTMDVAGVCLSSDRAGIFLGGVGRYRSKSHGVISANGGELEIDGFHQFTIAGGAAAASVACIDITADSAQSATAFPGPEIVITGTVIIDATLSSATTPIGVKVASGCKLVVRGLLRILLPATATLFSAAAGRIVCEGQGRIEYVITGTSGVTSSYDSYAIRLTDLASLETMEGIPPSLNFGRFKNMEAVSTRKLRIYGQNPGSELEFYNLDTNLTDGEMAARTAIVTNDSSNPLLTAAAWEWRGDGTTGLVKHVYARSVAGVLTDMFSLAANGFTYLTLPGPYANDAAAAAASPAVAIGQAYRVTGGTIAWRQV